MQQFTYAGYTVRYESLSDDVIPIAIGLQVDGILALVCRYPEDAEEVLTLLEVQVCRDCHIMQRTEDETCLLCGGSIDWAYEYDEAQNA